jgi:crossover junction endodeoxyribonuclease RuvC
VRNLHREITNHIVMIALGIDPGIRGGLAVVSTDNGVGVLLDAIDIPTVGGGAKERVDVMAVRDFIQRHGPTFALIERAQAMPRQGSSSGFKYGRATGALETAVALCAIPLEIIEPTAWKRFWHLPAKDKERSRQCALEIFPVAHSLLARKRDHGRAEAALIALYGLRNSRLMATPPGAQPGLVNDEAPPNQDYLQCHKN